MRDLNAYEKYTANEARRKRFYLYIKSEIILRDESHNIAMFLLSMYCGAWTKNAFHTLSLIFVAAL